MDSIAQRYVRVVLALGQHDADYVDAYYGPPEWKAEAQSAKLGLPAIAERAAAPAARPETWPHPTLRCRASGGTISIASSPRSRHGSGCSKASACRSTRNPRAL